VYDILDRFRRIPLRLFKFKKYHVITTGKHANEFLTSKCLEAVDLQPNFLQEIDFSQKLIIFVREPKERLVSGLAQEWYDVIWPTIHYAKLDRDIDLISKSFNTYIASTLLDTVCRHDPTHVAPWLHMAYTIKTKRLDSVSVIDFKNIKLLCDLLEIKDRTNIYTSYVDHRSLSNKFTPSINKMIDYYLRYEYKYYDRLIKGENANGSKNTS
jgi:hypothetical protein